MIVRQALAGMMWTKQWFHYDVEQWLDGDPAGPPPPEGRDRGRNHEWRHLNTADVLTVCDTWEYPWFATWDLAFQCVAIAHLDPEFAKEQLLLMCREWYMHPNGQLPAYEWAFGDVNPPVHAWAALRVFAIDGATDLVFLERIFQKLLLNFTWWVNRKDAAGDNVFEGGFLGLDNIGPIDRSAPLPVEGRLEQSDATGWMAMFCLNMLEIALILGEHRSPAYEDMCTKFLEHFAYIATAIHDHGLWDDEDGFYYDVLRIGDERIPLRVRSVVGLLPLCAVTTLSPRTLAALPGVHRPPRLVRRAPPAVRPPHRPSPPAGRHRGPAAGHRRPGAAGPHPRPAARRGRAALAARHPLGLRPPPRGTLRAAPRRHGHERRLRAGRGHDRPVRRQLELARVRCGSRSTRSSSMPCGPTAASSATTSSSSTRPAPVRAAP